MNTSPSTSPTVVVLAAGARTRLGKPKALVEIGGVSVVSALLDAAGHGFQRVVVVTGAHHAEIVEHLVATGRLAGAGNGESVELTEPRSTSRANGATGALSVVHNLSWSAGRTTSVQCAVRAEPGCDLVIAPVDVPRVPAAVFAALLRSWNAAGAPALGWLAPAVLAPDGTRRFGHPVLIGRELAAQLEGAAPDRPLALLRRRAEPLFFVDVDDERVLEDLDTPQDLAELQRRAATDRR